MRHGYGLGTLVLFGLLAQMEAPAGATPLEGDFGLGGASAAQAPAESGVDVSIRPRGIHFGSTTEAVAKLYDKWWDKRFVHLYRRANPGPKTRELDHRLAARKRLLRRVASFDGVSNSFDKSDFRQEFAHGNRETMTWAKVAQRVVGGPSLVFTRRFFFHRDRLWKVYDEHRLGRKSALGDSFEEAVRRIEAGLPGKPKRTRPPTGKWRSVVFDLGAERLRLIDLPGGRLGVVRTDEARAVRVLGSRELTAQAPEPEIDESVQEVLRPPDPLPPGLRDAEQEGTEDEDGG